MILLSLETNVAYGENQSSTSYTSEEVAIGKANATWKYYIYNSKVPGSFKRGTIKILCSDEGTISDSGF